MEIERRTIKAKRTYDDACDRPRQKESGIKRFQQKILPKVIRELFFFVCSYIRCIFRMKQMLKFFLAMHGICISYKYNK